MRAQALTDVGQLEDVGVGLGELGRGEEALAAAQEALNSTASWLRPAPDAFRPELAMALSNLASG